MSRLTFPIVLIVGLFATGCGGGSSNSGSSGSVPGVVVQVMTPKGAGAVDGNQTLGITVQVTDNGQPDSSGVNWNVAPDQNGGPVGTLSNVQSTSVTYNPPAGISSTAQVTVTATSVSDPTRSAAIPISVYPTPTIITQSSDLGVAYKNIDYACIEMPITGAGVLQVPCQVVATGGLGPYTWSLGNSQLPLGLQLAPGNPNQYPCNALPGSNCEEIIGQATTPGVFQFSITGTDSLGSASTVPLTISVAPSQLKVTTPTLLATLQNLAYAPVQLQANGGQPTGGQLYYTWSLAPGSGPLPPGLTLSPNGVISGTPTTQITGDFALQVVDNESPVPSQAIFPVPQVNPSSPNIIAIGQSDTPLPCGPNQGTTVLPNTPYAFVFTGFDADGPVTLSGSFTVDNQGNLVNGEEDTIRSSGAQTAAALTSGTSITFNQTGRGCLTLNTASSTAQYQVAPTTLTSGGAGTYYSDGRIVEFDDQNGTGTRGTGYFHIQDGSAFSTSAISGPYAFRLGGWNSSSSRFAMAGTATATNGLITSAAADINDGGALSGALTGGSGTIGAVDSNGRGTATLTIGSDSYDLIFYILDSSHLIFNSPQAAISAHPLLTGEATASPGPFLQASLNNSHIYRFAGSVAGSPDLGVGVFHFDGIGATSGTAYERSGGTPTTTTISQAFTVDSTTGRFTLSGNGPAVIGYAVSEASGVTGYLVGTGATAASGTMEFQTDSYPPGYQFGPLNTVYGLATEELTDPQTTAFAGQINVAPSGAFSFGVTSYLDSSRPTGLAPFQEFEMFQYTWAADGSGTFGGNTYMVTNGSKFFSIDISPLNGHPAAVVGHLQTAP